MRLLLLVLCQDVYSVLLRPLGMTTNTALRGGLFNRHASGHEQFAWDIRSEPGLIDVFSKIWGTDELAVSFDGVNVSLPFKEDATVDRKPWPHVDQSPNRRYKYCIQGIMNLVSPPGSSALFQPRVHRLFFVLMLELGRERTQRRWIDGS